MMTSIRPFTRRMLHTSTRACNLVAPPDPVSHMRPIIYNDVPPPPPPSYIRHPYSLAEFAPIQPGRDTEPALQYRLYRQQIDVFHQEFWFDSNIRFTVAKQAVLAGLPPSVAVLDKEKALSIFYRQWYLQEAAATREYTTEWRRRVLILIKLSLKVEVENLATRLSNFFLRRKKVATAYYTKTHNDS